MEVDPPPEQKAREAASAMNLRLMLEDMEKQYNELKESRDALQDQYERAEKGRQEAIGKGVDKDELNSAHNQLKLELQNTKLQLEEAKTEAKSRQERESRALAESDRLREEISGLTAKNSTLGAKVASMEVDSKLQESEAIPLMHEKDRLKTEMESLQTHSNWLQSELNAKNDAFQRLQNETHDRQLQLQLQLQQTENEKEAFSVREQELRKIEGRLQTQVEQLSRDLMLAKQEVANVKESTALEVQQEQKLANLQKEHLVRWEQRYNDVVRENESLKSAASDAQTMLDRRIGEARSEVEAKYKQLLDDQATEHKMILDKGETRLVPGGALPAASEEDSAPMGLTEVYERLEQAKAQLRSETLRADRAELLNRRIVKEIEEKTPIMNRQREEYELAMDQMQNYQLRLERALQDKDDARTDGDEARRVATQWKQQYNEKVKEAKILAKQVQTLLLQRAGGEVGDVSIPTSVASMQSHNQQLLLETERLKEKIENLEQQVNQDELSSKLEDANSELESLREQRKLQEGAVEKIVQQRDLYRSLCNVSGSMSSSQELSVQEYTKQQAEKVKNLERELSDADRKLLTVSGERDKLLRDRETTDERLLRYETHNKELTESFNKLEGDLRVARGDLAREHIESQYGKDRCARLEESVQRLREEVGQVTSAKIELQRINAELQHSLTRANNLASQNETEKQQAETRLRLAETQAETSKLSQKRATDEAAQLRAEVARQGVLIDSIRRIENSLTAKSEGELESLKEELGRQVKNATGEKKRFEAEIKNLNERVSEAEARFHEATKVKDKAEAEAASAKKALDKARSGSQDNVDVASQEKVDALTTELASAKDEIKTLEDTLADYKKVAKGSEASMAEVSKVAASMKQSQKEEVERLKTQLANAEKEGVAKQDMIVEMTKDLSGQREEREKAEASLKLKITGLETQLQVKEKDFESLEAAFAASKVDFETMQSDLSLAQSNYERELKLHSDARGDLRNALEKADVDSKEKAKAVTEVSELKSTIDKERENWASEKKAMVESSQTLEKRLKGAQEHNTLLHTQLEKLGKQIQQSQAARADAASKGSNSEPGFQLDEMRQVIKFLRSEQQMIQAQLDTKSRAAERERAGAAVLKQSLDDARSELAVLKESSDAGKSSVAELTQATEKLRSANEQVALLNDSNKLLREETERLRENAKASEQEIRSTKAALAPSESEKHKAEARLAELTSENQSLRRELESWKGRVESLVKKFNQVDPEEHRKALEQVEALTKEQQSAAAWKTNMEGENKRIREIARNVNQKLKELRGQLEGKTKEVEKLMAEKVSLSKSSEKEAIIAKERDDLKTRLTQVNKSMASTKTELDGANARNEKFREKLREFQTRIRELQANEKKLKAELSTKPSTKPKQESTPPSSGEPAKAATKQPFPAKAAPKTTDPAPAAKEKPQVVAPLPAVPDGGFSFGPSPASSKKMVATPVKEKQQVEATPTPDETKKQALRAEAPTFAPAKKTVPDTKPPSKPPAKPQGSGEQSMKEKLMAKKRKLAELKERKQAELALKKAEEKDGSDKRPADKPQAKTPSTTGLSEQPAAKKVKKEDEAMKQVVANVTNPAPATSGIASAGQGDSADTGKAKGTEAPLPSATGADMSTDEKAAEQTTNEAAGAKKPESQTGQESSEQSFKNPFSLGGSNPFGSAGSEKPFSFAVGGQAPAAAVAAAGVPPSSGFLTNMKPPGSSSSPLQFSFGKTGSISLPIPTQPAPQSPFGFPGGSAFPAPSAPFGGFGDSQPIPAKPLFGDAESKDEKDDESKE